MIGAAHLAAVGREEKNYMKYGQYGPCGLYCGACAATDCSGCASDFIDESVRGCYFRNCSKEKQIEACCFCGKYPCEKLSEFMTDEWPHHWTMKANLEFINNNGIYKWLEQQKQEWLCGDCKQQIYWYQKECKCGKLLEGWDHPK